MEFSVYANYWDGHEVKIGVMSRKQKKWFEDTFKKGFPNTKFLGTVDAKNPDEARKVVLERLVLLEDSKNQNV